MKNTIFIFLQDKFLKRVYPLRDFLIKQENPFRKLEIWKLLILLSFFYGLELPAQLSISYSDWSIAANKYRNNMKSRWETEGTLDSLILNSNNTNRNVSVQRYKRDQEHANFAMVGLPLSYLSKTGKWELNYSGNGISSNPTRQNSFLLFQRSDTYDVTANSRTHANSSDFYYVSLSPDNQFRFSKFDHIVSIKFFINKEESSRFETFLNLGLKYQTYTWSQTQPSFQLTKIGFNSSGFGSTSIDSPPSIGFVNRQDYSSMGPSLGIGTKYTINPKNSFSISAGISILNGKILSDEGSLSLNGNNFYISKNNANEKNMIGYGANLDVQYEYEILNNYFFKILLMNQTTSYQMYKNEKYNNVNLFFGQNFVSGSFSTESFVVYPQGNNKFSFYPKEKIKSAYLLDIFSALSFSVYKKF